MGIEPNLFALSRMAVLKDFDLIGCRHHPRFNHLHHMAW
jgi:hypothetical protein